MTTEKNSPKRSEPKVKRPTPNLDVFEKSVRSYQEWLDTTFKDITDKQELIHGSAGALFDKSNEALLNSLLESTDAIVRKPFEEKERLERIIFKDEHGDKNAVRRLNRYQELYNALKPILKYAIDKLDKILAEIEKMQNGTSTSSESSSMVPPPPPLPPPLEDDAGDPPLVPPKDDVPPPMTPDQAKEIIEGAKIVMNEGQPSNDSGWWGAFCGGVKSAINLVGRLFKGNEGSLDEEQAIELEELKEKTVQVSSIVDMTNRAKELLDKLRGLKSKISEKSDSLQVPRKLVMRINLTIKGLEMNLNEVNSGSDIDAAERKAKRLSNAVERAGKVYEETSEQLGMTTEKNSPKRSEPKVKLPTPNLDVFKKSVLSSKEWIDTTFKNITDKQEEIQSVAEALFGESNKALRNSLLERTNAVVRKLLEEKERLERIIFKDDYGDKNVVRMSDRFRRLCDALEFPVKFANGKLNEISAEIAKMPNETSTSSKSGSMVPPTLPKDDDSETGSKSRLDALSRIKLNPNDPNGNQESLEELSRIAQEQSGISGWYRGR